MTFCNRQESPARPGPGRVGGGTRGIGPGRANSSPPREWASAGSITPKSEFSDNKLYEIADKVT